MDESLFADGLLEDFRRVPWLAARIVLRRRVFFVAVTTRPARPVESQGGLGLTNKEWRSQKLIRALSWISRPGVETSVMLPKLAVLTKRLGVP